MYKFYCCAKANNNNKEYCVTLWKLRKNLCMYKQMKMYKSIKYKPFSTILMNTTGTMMQTLWMTHMWWLKLYNYNCEDIITKIVLYPATASKGLFLASLCFATVTHFVKSPIKPMKNNTNLILSFIKLMSCLIGDPCSLT